RPALLQRRWVGSGRRSGRGKAGNGYGKKFPASVQGGGESARGPARDLRPSRSGPIHIGKKRRLSGRKASACPRMRQSAPAVLPAAGIWRATGTSASARLLFGRFR